MYLLYLNFKINVQSYLNQLGCIQIQLPSSFCDRLLLTSDNINQTIFLSIQTNCKSELPYLIMLPDAILVPSIFPTSILQMYSMVHVNPLFKHPYILIKQNLIAVLLSPSRSYNKLHSSTITWPSCKMTLNCFEHLCEVLSIHEILSISLCRPPFFKVNYYTLTHHTDI